MRRDKTFKNKDNAGFVHIGRILKSASVVELEAASGGIAKIGEGEKPITHLKYKILESISFSSLPIVETKSQLQKLEISEISEFPETQMFKNYRPFSR